LARIVLILAVIAVGGFVYFQSVRRDDVKAALEAARSSSEEAEANDAPKRPRTQFAQDRAAQPPPEVKLIDFDGKRAMGYLETICAIGPRMSGSRGMKRQQDVIDKHFRDLGLTVEMQSFTVKQASQREEVKMANMIVSIHPERKRRIILCSHYDTRPIADQEEDPRKWREPFVSANDGGSGVAFLMELGHHLPKLTTPAGIDLVFFDGEEYIFERNRDEYFFGSKHFAQAWRKQKDRPDYAAAVLFDMIAGKDPKFPVEGYSWVKARELCLNLWGIAGELKCGAFQERIGDRVLDDHLALQNAGIDAIDIIDFDYPHWHKLSDTPENCSAEGMIQVAKVIGVWLGRMK
jgi:glutaminyl-peptide cyclotransferase